MPQNYSSSPREQQTTTTKHFNQHSDFWLDVYQQPDTFPGYCLLQQHQFVVQLIEETQGANRILDVGCGSGFTMLELAQRDYIVSGIDIAPKMIEVARHQAAKHNLDCDFRVANAEDLPYSDQHFDVVIALGLLANLPDDQPTLREIHRVLKPSGRLILSMPNQIALDRIVSFPRSLPILLGFSPLRHRLRSLANIARRVSGHNIKPLSQLRFGRSVTPGRYQHYLNKHGFTDVSHHALTYGPMIPFGLVNFDNKQQIRISKKLEHWSHKWHGLGRMGTIIIYDGWRT